MLVNEAQSVYQAKLNQFLSDQPADVQKWVKKCLNSIFIGIGKDFDGYVEGKRPVIKDLGEYRLFKMMIQAKSDVKKGSNDKAGKWNFYDPVKEYCKGLGSVISKKIDGDSYSCVVNSDLGDLSDVVRASEYEDKTSQASYPMVGTYATGIGGSYKNITKDVPGTTYSVIVSLPVAEGERKTYSNPNMTKQGNRYAFSGKTGDEKFSVEFDASANKFSTTQYKDGSYDTFNVTYKPSSKAFKAFKELVDRFDTETTISDVERILNDFGVKMQHSWWFNPYVD